MQKPPGGGYIEVTAGYRFSLSSSGQNHRDELHLLQLELAGILHHQLELPVPRLEALADLQAQVLGHRALVLADHLIPRLFSLPAVGGDPLQAHRAIRGNRQPGAVHAPLHGGTEVQEAGLEVADDGFPGVRGATDAVNPVRAGGVVFALELAEAVELVALELADRA